MDENSVFNKLVFVTTQKILLPIISMKGVAPDYVRKENWPLNSFDVNVIDNAICEMMEMMVYVNVRRFEDIKDLSPVISDGWDRLTKYDQ